MKTVKKIQDERSQQLQKYVDKQKPYKQLVLFTDEMLDDHVDIQKYINKLWIELYHAKD